MKAFIAGFGVFLAVGALSSPAAAWPSKPSDYDHFSRYCTASDGATPSCRAYLDLLCIQLRHINPNAASPVVDMRAISRAAHRLSLSDRKAGDLRILVASKGACSIGPLAK